MSSQRTPKTTPRADPRPDGKMGIVVWRHVVQGSNEWRKATKEALIVG